MIKEKLPITTEIVILSVSSKDTTNYRKLSDKTMSVLLIREESGWYLPSEAVSIGESIDECALRTLKEKTNIHDIYIEQLYTFGDVNRVKDDRIVSCSYVALIDKNKIMDQLSEQASWFDIDYHEDEEYITASLTNGDEILFFKIKKVLRKNTTDRYEFYIDENKGLIYDHPLIIASGISRIKSKLNYTDIVFNMVGEEFTIGELQQVYETILGKKLISAAFRRTIANKIESTGKFKTGVGHRPSELYRLKKEGE